MRRTLILSFLLIFLLPSWNLRFNALNPSAQDVEPASGSVVCPPDLNKAVPSDCLTLGPAEYLAQSAALGLPYPIVPLPAYFPDRSLADTSYQYYKVSAGGDSLYPSLDAAASHQPSMILYPSKHLYVSYVGDAVSTGQGSFYQLRSGNWVPILSEGGRLARYNPPFQGLIFSSTPHNAFGWILGETHPRTSPGLNSPESGSTYYRFQVVQVYAMQEADNITWELVGPGEWVDARQIARVDPDPVAPKGISGNRWISVNLLEQTVAVYDKNQLIFATMASTGVAPFWTRPGIFQIREKLETTTMSNSVQDDFYYLEDVPWTMYFDEARALHGAYWHNYFGYPQSHGCVNLSEGDSHWLYNWASMGDYVYVYDPSGKTPTDPSLFGSGAP